MDISTKLLIQWGYQGNISGSLNYTTTIFIQPSLSITNAYSIQTTLEHHGNYWMCTGIAVALSNNQISVNGHSRNTSFEDLAVYWLCLCNLVTSSFYNGIEVTYPIQ